MRKLLDAYRRRQLSEFAAIRVEEHLSNCRDCYEVYEKIEALSELIQSSAEQLDADPRYYQTLVEQVLDREELRRRLGPALREWFEQRTEHLKLLP